MWPPCLISHLFVFWRCLSHYLSQKNLRKNIGKTAKGCGDRVVRNFANAAVRARTEWLEAGGSDDTDWNPWLWPESFVEKFNHMAFHLQGECSFQL